MEWTYINRLPIPFDLLDARRKDLNNFKHILGIKEKTLKQRLRIWVVDKLYEKIFFKPELSK